MLSQILRFVFATLFFTQLSAAQTIEVTFDNHPAGAYTSTLMEQDFVSVDVYNGPDGRFNIVTDPQTANNKFLRVTYPEGQVGASRSGGQFINQLTPSEEYFLDYYIRFDDNFDFQLGGKIPGLSGGRSNTGGNRPTGDGWSARFMWREGGRAVVYLYHMDQPSNFGHDFELNRSFNRGQWHRLTQRIKVNTGNNNDGILQVWFDGELVILRNDIRYRNNNQAPVDHFYFSTFYGGNTSDWAPDYTSTISYDNFRIGTDASEIIPGGDGTLLTSIIRPGNGAVFEGPANIQIEASAFSITNDIREVTLLNGQQELARLSQEPYEFLWQDVQPGTYTLSARIEDGQQNTTNSAPVTVVVTRPDQDKGPNLALNRPVATTGEQEGNRGEEAVDGSTDPEDRWSASGYPQSLTVDMGEIRSIDLLEILPYQDRAYQYTVESSLDGTSFSSLLDRSANTASKSVLADFVQPTDARYLRLSVSDAHDYSGEWISIIEFRAFSTASSTSPPVVMGDANGDQKITPLDASLVFEIALDLSEPDAETLAATDVTGDGVVDMEDAIMLLQYVVGIIDCLPTDAACR